MPRRPPPAAARVRLPAVIAAAAAIACGVAGVAPAADTATTPAIPTDFAIFQKTVSPRVADAAGIDARHWRQVEPAVHHLATLHADRLGSLDDTARLDTLVALARFIDRQRAVAADRPVFAKGRAVIGLLDPDQGLDPKEITAISAAYGCPATVFKRDAPGETIAGVADAFLEAVGDAVRAASPVTIVVLGHGLPTEIQSYAIRFERLADALLQIPRGGPADTVDLGRVVLVCDDCYSADFLINLQAALAAGCRTRGLTLRSPPVCIAGTNRNCVGHADVGGKFVPHFWRDVIELYFIRRPLPDRVVLRNFFDNVDHMMYGYGRAPVMEGGRVTDWRLVDATLVQDPVVFVPLDDAARAELRRILGVAAHEPMPAWLDVG
jgi:hypothetical protein